MKSGFLLATAALLLVPDLSFAWGPGFHLQLGTTVLGNLQNLPAAVAAVIGAHPNDFLYGCIAADITLGKKYTHYLSHCHRWNIGLKLLDEADSGARKSCAWGYLSHLAADTVSHGYYVPINIMRSFPTLILKHAYWEVRFDSFINPEMWALGRTVAVNHFEDNDALLRRVIANTLFSFGTNKKIFNSILLVGRLEKWQQLIQTMNDVSRFQLEDDERYELVELTTEAVFSILADCHNSPWLKADPTGERALDAAEKVRKNLRLLYQSGKVSKTDANGEVEALRMKLRAAIQQPEQIRQILSV
ncbi:MAG TPA: zinc dependent phospholipase C family protein [Geobacteraceae bacterium]|nr:zinc dependent phospholipase C family protein [Geobacteraceae bacterium]